MVIFCRCYQDGRFSARRSLQCGECRTVVEEVVGAVVGAASGASTCWR